MTLKPKAVIDQEQLRIDNLDGELDLKVALDPRDYADVFIDKVDDFQEKIGKLPENLRDEYGKKLVEFLRGVDAKQIDSLAAQLNDNLDVFFKELTKSVKKKYVIKKGDWLSKIALRCINKNGESLSWEDLYDFNKKKNNLKSGDAWLIHPEEELEFPEGYFYFDESILPKLTLSTKSFADEPRPVDSGPKTKNKEKKTGPRLKESVRADQYVDMSYRHLSAELKANVDNLKEAFDMPQKSETIWDHLEDLMDDWGTKDVLELSEILKYFGKKKESELSAKQVQAVQALMNSVENVANGKINEYTKQRRETIDTDTYGMRFYNWAADKMGLKKKVSDTKDPLASAYFGVSRGIEKSITGILGLTGIDIDPKSKGIFKVPDALHIANLVPRCFGLNLEPGKPWTEKALLRRVGELGPMMGDMGTRMSAVYEKEGASAAVFDVATFIGELFPPSAIVSKLRKVSAIAKLKRVKTGAIQVSKEFVRGKVIAGKKSAAKKMPELEGPVVELKPFIKNGKVEYGLRPEKVLSAVKQPALLDWKPDVNSLNKRLDKANTVEEVWNIGEEVAKLRKKTGYDEALLGGFLKKQNKKMREFALGDSGVLKTRKKAPVVSRSVENKPLRKQTSIEPRNFKRETSIEKRTSPMSKKTSIKGSGLKLKTPDKILRQRKSIFDIPEKELRAINKEKYKRVRARKEKINSKIEKNESRINELHEYKDDLKKGIDNLKKQKIVDLNKYKTLEKRYSNVEKNIKQIQNDIDNLKSEKYFLAPDPKIVYSDPKKLRELLKKLKNDPNEFKFPIEELKMTEAIFYLRGLKTNIIKLTKKALDNCKKKNLDLHSFLDATPQGRKIRNIMMNFPAKQDMKIFAHIKILQSNIELDLKDIKENLKLFASNIMDTPDNFSKIIKEISPDEYEIMKRHNINNKKRMIKLVSGF